MQEPLDRPLPSSPDAERAILGAIVLDNLLIEQAKRDCPADWFYSPAHRRIFTAMLSLNEQKSEINALLLSEELKRDGSLESVGGTLFLSNLTDGIFSVRNLKNYIAHVRESHRRRWAVKFGAMLTEQALEGDVSPDEMFALAISRLDTMRGLSFDKRGPKSLEELADDQLARYELFFQGVSDALPTGFRQIDDHLLGGGLVPSALYVLAAQTSMGKSTLGLDIAANIGGTGRRTYIVSREMSRESLFDRLVAFESGVHRWKIRPGIWDGDYKQVQQGVVRLAQKPIVLDDSSLTVSEIRGYLREADTRGDRVELLLVDYLQLLEAEGRRRETRNQEVGSLSRSLKSLAMEFRIPVISIAQLKRFDNREPELSDLRDSGEIEQDADVVMFLFGDRPDEGQRFYERTLKCAKQREGPLFREQLPFNGELVTYRARRLEEVA